MALTQTRSTSTRMQGSDLFSEMLQGMMTFSRCAINRRPCEVWCSVTQHWQASRGSHRLPEASMGFQRLPEAPTGFHRHDCFPNTQPEKATGGHFMDSDTKYFVTLVLLCELIWQKSDCIPDHTLRWMSNNTISVLYYCSTSWIGSKSWLAEPCACIDHGNWTLS